MEKTPIVKDFRIVLKGLLNKTRKVSFKCPHCQHALLSSEEELNGPELCPHCGNPFEVTPDAKAVLRAKRKKEENAAKEAERQAEEVAAQKEQELKDQWEAEQLQRAEDRKEVLRKRDAEMNARFAMEAAKRAEEQKASESESESNPFVSKGRPMTSKVRSYPAMETIKLACDVAVVLNVIGAIIGCVVVSYAEMAFEGKVVGIALLFVEVAFAVLILTLLKECVKLAVNVAQDTERIMRVAEARAGK